MTLERVEALAELAATVDYIKDITEHSETLDFELASELQDAVLRVKACADECSRMLAQSMLKRLEDGGPRQFGGRIFGRVKQYTKRHDHDRIASEAYQQAILVNTDPDTGEVDSQGAIKSAIRFMRSVYLSDSSTAKVTPLKAIGLSKRDYEVSEFKAWGLNVTVVDAEAFAEVEE